jgi:pimeloyl-ACP methyl ester carboxylesterase
MPPTALFGQMAVTEHEFKVPLDHDDPNAGAITVFAREVVAADKVNDHRPWLLFLQGGPGFGGPKPLTRSGWIKRALEEFRVLLLDDRGTGRSAQLGAQSLARLKTSKERADYLKLFRADAIVRDAEWIRKRLIGDEPWTVLGQSYGGFCAVHYLSAAPAGLRAALIAGGLPSLHRPAEDVYRATFPLVAARHRRWFERYPEDADRVRRIVQTLEKEDVRLPGGDRLTSRRFRGIGLALGMSDGFETLHYLLEEAWIDGRQGRELGYPFLRGVDNALPYGTNPIFAILHEPCYAQGVSTRWAAQRLMKEFPAFDDPAMLTGEMIFPWMFEEYGPLRPLREEAEILAAFDGWPALYDRKKLAKNKVPCAAALYLDDMYVPRGMSEETADDIAGLRLWATNEFDHNGIRAEGEKILSRLLDLSRNRV